MIDNTTRFDGLATAYDRHRPTYPTALFERIVAPAPTDAARAVDVAAGTGISTAMLLATLPAGWRIVAVEPGADMRRVLRARFAAEPGVEIVDGTAEALGLGCSSAGVITVCAAFHWFDADRFLREAGRVLMPGGVLAVVNNRRLPQPVTDAFDAYLFQDDPDRIAGIAARRARQEATLRAAPGFAGFASQTVRWSRPLTASEAIGDWMTRSVAKPMIEKFGRDQVEADLAEAYRSHLGEASMILDYDATALTITRSP